MRSSDGTATGGHFASPFNKPTEHGLPADRVRHWGDFGSVLANKGGYARYARSDRVITIEGIIGHGMIVHELQDQGHVSQPTGGAGARQAQCVIGLANPDIK